MSWNWGGKNVPEKREIRDIPGHGWVVISVCDGKGPTRTSAFPGLSFLRDTLSFSTPGEPAKNLPAPWQSFLAGGMIPQDARRR
jgi:hypothetical protein